MPREIQVGTILMEDRPAMTQALEIDGESFSGSWSMLKTVGSSTLESKVRAAGWNFVFLADELKAIAFGSFAAENSQRALRRILAQVQQQNFNCLEITRITPGRFLGIPFTTIVGHSRHIQQGWILQRADERRSAQTDADWARQKATSHGNVQF
jgi:hypothetical protein